MIPTYDPILDRYAAEIQADEQELCLNGEPLRYIDAFTNPFRFHPGERMQPDPTNVTRPIRMDRSGMPHAATSIVPQPLPKREQYVMDRYTTSYPVVDDIRDLRANDVSDLNFFFWSKGKPALPAPVKPRRPGPKPVDEMTVEEIAATVNDELPSTSRLMYEETGKGVLSLDRTSTMVDGDESDTLAAVIAGDHWLRDAYPEAFDDDADPELAAHVYDLWLDGEAMTKRYGNAVMHQTHISPEIRARIEWERFMAQCSDVQREGLRRRPDGTYGFYSLVGRRLDKDEFQARKAAFVAQFLRDTGLARFPSAAEFDRRNAMRKHPTVKAQLRQLERMGDAVSKALLDLENQRFDAFDDDGATSSQRIDTAYEPELATFIFRVRRDSMTDRPEYGTPAYTRWLDSTRLAATALHAKWMAEHADKPQLLIQHRNGRPTGDQELWHQENWLRQGIDWVRKSTAASVALGTHPTK